MSAGPSPSSELGFPALPELRSSTVAGNTIRYYDIGAGPVLLLIHGIGGDADEWAFCFAGLAASYRVIALDLLGFGRSDKPHIAYTIAVFVDLLQVFLTNLGITRATLAGNSLGGWIAASFTLRFPERVDKLVLVDSAGVWEGIHELPIDLRVSTRAHLREIFDLLFHDKSLVNNLVVDLAYRQHLERGDAYTIESVLANLQDGSERLDERIVGLQVPTLIIWGEHDLMIPVETGRRLQRLIAGSKLHIIGQCGHLPALEKPAEFVACVLQFLDSRKSSQETVL